MKILILANQLLGHKITSGGDVIFVELLKRWAKAKSNNITVSLPQSGAAAISDIDNVEKIKLNWTGADKKDSSSIRVLWLLPLYLIRSIEATKKLARQNPNIIYSTGDFICNTLPAVFLKIKRKNIKWVANIYHLNRPPIFRSSNPFWRSFFSYLLQRGSVLLIKHFADQVFILNTEVKGALIKRGFHKEKLFTTGAGLDLKMINKIKADPELSFDGCFLGRLNYTKGAFELPEIWSKVVAKNPQAKLAVVGHGAGGDLKKIIFEIKKYKLDGNVKLFGFLPAEKMYQVLKASKVFVFPSHEEGWGISLCEALACGAVPVTYNLPVFKEVLQEGIVSVPVGQKNVMALKILELLSNEQKRKKLIVAGQKVIEKYDWDELAEKELSLINFQFSSPNFH